MKTTTLFLLAFVFGLPLTQAAGTSDDKTALITFLNEKITKGTAAMTPEKDLSKQPLSPPEDETSLLAAQALIQKTSDIELIKLLLQYQTVYLNPENDKVARIIGEIFYDQTSAFEEANEQLSANQRLLLFPYLKFGWSKVIEGKNTSLPSVLEKQRRFDKIARSLINLRGYQDQPNVESAP
jgi:hypothetical protein